MGSGVSMFIKTNSIITRSTVEGWLPSSLVDNLRKGGMPEIAEEIEQLGGITGEMLLALADLLLCGIPSHLNQNERSFSRDETITMLAREREKLWVCLGFLGDINWELERKNAEQLHDRLNSVGLNYTAEKFRDLGVTGRTFVYFAKILSINDVGLSEDPEHTSPVLLNQTTKRNEEVPEGLKLRMWLRYLKLQELRTPKIEQPLTLLVKMPTGETDYVEAFPSDTIYVLKQKLLKKYRRRIRYDKKGNPIPKNKGKKEEDKKKEAKKKGKRKKQKRQKKIVPGPDDLVDEGANRLGEKLMRMTCLDQKVPMPILEIQRLALYKEGVEGKQWCTAQQTLEKQGIYYGDWLVCSYLSQEAELKRPPDKFQAGQQSTIGDEQKRQYQQWVFIKKSQSLPNMKKEPSKDHSDAKSTVASLQSLLPFGTEGGNVGYLQTIESMDDTSANATNRTNETDPQSDGLGDERPSDRAGLYQPEGQVVPPLALHGNLLSPQARTALYYLGKGNESGSEVEVKKETVSMSAPEPIPMNPFATSDHKALMDLYNNCGGSEWTSQKNWGFNEPIGRWHGVITDKQGRVISLALPHNNLVGELPKSLGKLSELQVLALPNNPELSGTIPSEIGELKNLYKIDLNGNTGMVGKIPEGILTMVGLKLLTGSTGLIMPSVSMVTPSFDIYMIPTIELLSLNRLLPHEEAKDKGVIWELSHKEGCMFTHYSCSKVADVRREECAFVSHRWLEDDHPDDENNSKLKHLQTIAKKYPRIRLWWIDYLSVPQETYNHQLQINAIYSLAHYVKCCASFFLLTCSPNYNPDNRAHLWEYQDRGWCRYECIAAQCPVIGSSTNGLQFQKVQLETTVYLACKDTGQEEFTDASDLEQIQIPTKNQDESHTFESDDSCSASSSDSGSSNRLLDNPMEGHFSVTNDKDQIFSGLDLLGYYLSRSSEQKFLNRSRELRESLRPYYLAKSRLSKGTGRRKSLLTAITAAESLFLSHITTPKHSFT